MANVVRRSVGSMPASIPGVVVILGAAGGLVVGAYFGHLQPGAEIGGGLGFVGGLALLLMQRKRPAAKDPRPGPR